MTTIQNFLQNIKKPLNLNYNFIIDFRFHHLIITLFIISMIIMIYIIYKFKHQKQIQPKQQQILQGGFSKIKYKMKRIIRFGLNDQLTNYKKKQSNSEQIIRKYLWAYQELMGKYEFNKNEQILMNLTLNNTIRNSQLNLNKNNKINKLISSKSNKKVHFNQQNIVQIITY